jgi:hypothetical protein
MSLMRSKWLLIVPLVLAIALVLVTQPSDDHSFLSAANVSLGAGHAAAAGVPTPSAAEGKVQPPVPIGAATNKGDGEVFDVRHAPTVDAARIAHILSAYGSPAVGAAGTMHDLGVKYGIDPAYCLAFFIHESTAGTAGVARVTKSVGNIRTTPGYRDYEGYRHYASWEEGIEDWYHLIDQLYIKTWGLTTVDAIVPVYAPTSDGNDPDGYAATVKQLVTSWRAGR